MSDHPSQPAHPATATAAAEPGRLPRLLALTAVSVGVLVLAAAAFLFSYPGIHAIALHAGVSASLARGYPVIFDAMLVIAFAAVLSLRGAGLVSRCYAWLSLIVLLAAVAGASAAHSARVVIPHRPAAVTAAILPWALLLVGFGLLVAMLRHARMSRATARSVAARAAAARAAAAEQVPAPRLPAGGPIAALPPGAPLAAAPPPAAPAADPPPAAAPSPPRRTPAGTPSSATPALGLPALGLPALGSAALGPAALGSPALSSPALETPPLGTPALDSPAPGTPGPEMPGPGTPAPGSPAGSATPAPGGAPLSGPALLPPLPQIPSGLAGPARPGSGQQGPVPSAGAGQEDRAVAVPVRGRHAGGPAADGPDGAAGAAAGAAPAASEPASGQPTSGQQTGGQQTGSADDGLPDPDQGASNGAGESRPGLPKRVPAATLGENGDGGGSLARRTSVRIEETPVTAPAASRDAAEAGQSADTGTEPGPAAPPAFHRMWSSPTPPGEETD